MNLIAKIKRLEAEAVERDKRIAALEDKVAELQANTLPDAFVRDGGVFGDEPQPLIERNGQLYVSAFGGYALQSEMESAKPGAVIRLHHELPAEVSETPKKRKPRAKTVGTE